MSFEQNWSSGLANGELVKPENYFKGGPTVICVSEACFFNSVLQIYSNLNFAGVGVWTPDTPLDLRMLKYYISW